MKSIVLLIFFLCLLGCSIYNNPIIHYDKEYWSSRITGDTTTLRSEAKSYMVKSDTIWDITTYYKSGSLKSKVIMRQNMMWLELMEIKFVLDTAGNKLNFGKFKKGNGYVTEFDFNGSPRKEGLYVKGNREGWWKDYHYTGYIMDSTYYINGYPQYDAPSNSVDSLIDMFGAYKNNSYE